MKIPDILFHISTKRKWKEQVKNGEYTPGNYDLTGRVELLHSEKVQAFLNSNFKGRKHTVLLVIDTSRLDGVVKDSGEFGVFYIEKPLNTDSVLDRIVLEPDKNGLFDINIES